MAQISNQSYQDEKEQLKKKKTVRDNKGAYNIIDKKKSSTPKKTTKENIY